jgi:hypothetical protein
MGGITTIKKHIWVDYCNDIPGMSPISILISNRIIIATIITFFTEISVDK